uniref:Uncharacterized protein n=2 Tax=Strombidinopsis acuminata TaxID=141414 RepID=A0A7S3W7F6_9SPIT|mmetsp:Transcript_14095/g.43035  ORF Transcript_14095/g.43035 Transcript_14095/m.43035 type:complete len:233 (+) Transcript_14095:215-913(+)
MGSVAAELRADCSNLQAIVEWCEESFLQDDPEEAISQAQTYLVDALATVSRHIVEAATSLSDIVEAQGGAVDAVDARLRLVENKLAYHRARIAQDATTLQLASCRSAKPTGPALRPGSPVQESSLLLHDPIRASNGKLDLTVLDNVGQFGADVCVRISLDVDASSGAQSFGLGSFGTTSASTPPPPKGAPPPPPPPLSSSGIAGGPRIPAPTATRKPPPPRLGAKPPLASSR